MAQQLSTLAALSQAPRPNTHVATYNHPVPRDLCGHFAHLVHRHTCSQNAPPLKNKNKCQMKKSLRISMRDCLDKVGLQACLWDYLDYNNLERKT